MTDAAEWVAWAKDNAAPVQFLLGGVTGFLVTRLTMTKKERADVKQKIFENSRDLMVAQNALYQTFKASLQSYVSKTEPLTINDFLAVEGAGNNYFNHLKIVSGAILDNKVSAQARDDTLVPAIQRAVSDNLPSFYRVLQTIAERNDWGYISQLRRSDYEALYAVVEKYGASAAVNALVPAYPDRPQAPSADPGQE